MSLREQINGKKKVQEGKIVNDYPIEDYSKAKAIKEGLEADLPWNNYHITGVAGNYKIIEYSGDPQELHYE